MSKSSTEQFQIKKKRKHPLSSSQISCSTLNNCINNTTTKFVHSSTDLIIKENFSEFHDKNSKNSIQQQQQQHRQQQKKQYKSIAAATAAAKEFIETTAAIAKDSNSNSSRFSTINFNNCLRDQTQVSLRKSPDTMPLSQGFYVKGALASKRGLKSLKTNNAGPSASSSMASHELSKRPRTSGTENIKIRPQSLMLGQTTNNLQLSYLLGESLARHGRLQEAFDIYALIASEQPEGFIPLEKLNILATALLEHIRILSSNSKKSNDLIPDPELEQLTTATITSNNGSKSFKNDHNKLITPLRSKYSSATAATGFNWQLPNSSPLATSSSSGLINSEFLSATVGGNMDLHAPSRELSRVENPCSQEEYDPLLCPLCRDVLRCPVTTNCGHTFCRQCCETITMCNICHVKFPRWQKEEFLNETPSSEMKSALALPSAIASLSTATTTTTSSSQGLTLNHMPPNNQQLFSYSSSSSSTTHSSVAPFLATSSSITDMPRLCVITSSSSSSSSSSAMSPGNLTPPLASPTTVTTTTIACTTDTATTTMASTSSTSGVAIGLRGLTSNDTMKFMPDVLVRRLVEKWWGSDLQAKKINETATSYMHLNLLDDALKFCNASLEKSPSNFKSLLLRAEVLRKMNHYQSSLADVDNALKTRYTSAKAHYIRALALSDLSRYEEALYEICLAIGMDKSANLSNTELFQHDLTKILQKLLSQTPKCLKLDLASLRSKAPYSVYTEHRLRRKNISLLSNAVQHVDEEESLNPYEDDDFLSANYGKDCDILADEDVLACTDFLNCTDKRTTYASIAKKYELELKRQTSRKHFRRKWMQKETELLPPTIGVESARCSSQFRNVLERMQQEIVRLKKVESSPEYLVKQLAAVIPSLIDASDFDCVLCCRTFWKPVVTPCGHTYCLVCLDRCMDYTSSCPLCMSPLVEPSLNMYQGASSPVPLMLTKRPVTRFLEAAMKRFIPDSYNKRFRQEMDMEPSVPIFICTTAFPYVPCPLFVYEPRYRLMVRRAVESGEKQFGIVQPHSGKSRYYDYGCILDIRDCVLLGDGCSILSTIGCKRFKILARNEKDGYETAKVEYIHDETIPDEHLTYVSNMHDVVLSKAIQWYESLGEDLKHEILQSYGEMPIVEENWETIVDGPAWAWWIIALLPLRPQLKVDILATTSLEKRLRAIEKTIHSMPGNYHYQRVSQNCDVAVVVHNQQHLTHHDVDDEDEDDDEHLNNHLPDDEDDEAEDLTHIMEEHQQSSMQHHMPHESPELQQQQQHSPHTHLELQQQLHHHHQQQSDNVTTVDECCQRTSNTLHGQHAVVVVADDATTNDHNHHHHHHQQHLPHHANHTHSLLL